MHRLRKPIGTQLNRLFGARTAVLSKLAPLVADAAAHNHRSALALAGDRHWCVNSANALLHAAPFEDVLWVSTQAPAGAWSMPAADAHSMLGREVDAVVFDAYSGFDPDAFGAVSGTVRGGGLLLMLCPPLDEWPRFEDPEHERIAVAPYRANDVTGRFLRHVARTMRADENVAVIEQGRGDTFLKQRSAFDAGDAGFTPAEHDRECRTEDQRRAVDAIIKVVTGQRRRPVVLTSDRGRGKSAALGIAAAHLLRDGIARIVVTGPSFGAVAPVFAHARHLLPQASTSRSAVNLDRARIEFVAPDALARTPTEADLLLVDEAAAIPAPLLKKLLQRFSRIAFATTIHGYEGTGRGFALRFNKALDEHTRGWKQVNLETPIRWGPGDPVERFTFRALLLDAAAAPDDIAAQATSQGCEIERVDRSALVDDVQTLSELFGLLVLAHYRTRPCDLRHLLDGPNVSVYLMRFRRHVVGAALIAREGGFDRETSHAIREGRTRPHGHLIPESLAAHVGLEQAPQLRCARVMRVAIHPAAQNRGLGTQLLAAVTRDQTDEIAYIGSSFGATDELLCFWRQSGFKAVRLSIKRGAISGSHSAIVLKSLTERGGELVRLAHKRFLENFPHQLSDPFRELEPELAIRLLAGADAFNPPAISRQDWLDVVAFAFGRRVYESCIAPLWKLTCAALLDPDKANVISTTGKTALIVKVLQKRSWSEAAEILNVAGRAGVVEVLRSALRPLVEHYGNDAARKEAERLMHDSPLFKGSQQDQNKV